MHRLFTGPLLKEGPKKISLRRVRTRAGTAARPRHGPPKTQQTPGNIALPWHGRHGWHGPKYHRRGETFEGLWLNAQGENVTACYPLLRRSRSQEEPMFMRIVTAVTAVTSQIPLSGETRCATQAIKAIPSNSKEFKGIQRKMIK